MESQYQQTATSAGILFPGQRMDLVLKASSHTDKHTPSSLTVELDKGYQNHPYHNNHRFHPSIQLTVLSKQLLQIPKPSINPIAHLPHLLQQRIHPHIQHQLTTTTTTAVNPQRLLPHRHRTRLIRIFHPRLPSLQSTTNARGIYESRKTRSTLQRPLRLLQPHHMETTG